MSSSTKEEIIEFLAGNGRETTTGIANELGYTTGTVRRHAKDLKNDGKIQGEKAKRIPAYIIDGDFVVITGDRGQLLLLVEKYRPSQHERAKKMSTQDLQEFLREQVADDVVGGPKVWEFWV